MRPAAIVLFVVCFAFIGCGGISKEEQKLQDEFQEKYDKIEVGMSAEEACKILGMSYEPERRDQSQSVSTEDGSIMIYLNYKDDKVKAKSQIGLHD